jgi:ankyrin repeat protein
MTGNENVHALLTSGANVNLKNKEGETAWDLTTNDEIEFLLASYGAVTEEN